MPGSRGQALVEFAIAVPILILLVAGVIELGRGYSYAVAASDAAHDGARYVAGKTATTNGPGITAMCNLIGADLAAVSSSISCATQVGHAPPFVKGVDYTAPAGGQVVTLKVEKGQVAALVTYITALLSDLSPTEQPSTDMSLIEPVVPEWAVGALGVSYDELSDRVVVLAQELVVREEGEVLVLAEEFMAV